MGSNHRPPRCQGVLQGLFRVGIAKEVAIYKGFAVLLVYMGLTETSPVGVLVGVLACEVILYMIRTLNQTFPHQLHGCYRHHPISGRLDDNGHLVEQRSIFIFLTQSTPLSASHPSRRVNVPLSEYCKHAISKTNKSTMQIIIPGQSVVLPIRTNACISTVCGYRSHTLFVPEHSDSMTFYRSTLGKCKQKYSDPVCLWVTASHITIAVRAPMVCSENTYRNFLTPHLR